MTFIQNEVETKKECSRKIYISRACYQPAGRNESKRRNKNVMNNWITIGHILDIMRLIDLEF